MPMSWWPIMGRSWEIPMPNIENFGWYVSEVRQQLENAKYYLRFLVQETDNPQLLADHAQTLSGIVESLAEEEERIRQTLENSKTEEEKQQEAMMVAVKKAYYEETGENLLLSTADVMKALREEHARLRAAEKSYEAPQTTWGDFLNLPPMKKAWAKSIRERFSKLSGKREKP